MHRNWFFVRLERSWKIKACRVTAMIYRTCNPNSPMKCDSPLRLRFLCQRSRMKKLKIALTYFVCIGTMRRKAFCKFKCVGMSCRCVQQFGKLNLWIIFSPHGLMTKDETLCRISEKLTKFSFNNKQINFLLIFAEERKLSEVYRVRFFLFFQYLLSRLNSHDFINLPRCFISRLRRWRRFSVATS